MCGLCGTLGGPAHWSEGAAWLDTPTTRRAERLQQEQICRALLQPLGLRVDDWQGSAWIVSSGTGKREVLHSLPEVWRTAQRMTTAALDPLNPAWLAAATAPREDV